MLKKDGNELIFSTGRRISGERFFHPMGYNNLDTTECEELAVHMMTQWLRVYDKVNSEEVAEVDPCADVYECVLCGAFIIPGTESDYRHDIPTDKYYCGGCR